MYITSIPDQSVELSVALIVKRKKKNFIKNSRNM